MVVWTVSPRLASPRLFLRYDGKTSAKCGRCLCSLRIFAIAVAVAIGRVGNTILRFRLAVSEFSVIHSRCGTRTGTQVNEDAHIRLCAPLHCSISLRKRSEWRDSAVVSSRQFSQRSLLGRRQGHTLRSWKHAEIRLRLRGHYRAIIFSVRNTEKDFIDSFEPGCHHLAR